MRINLNLIVCTVIMIQWLEQLNDTFLKYLITNQLNFCFDDKKCKSKDIMDEINLESLDVLCGLSLVNTHLSGYAINTTRTKHTIFDDGRNRNQVKQKKLTLSTEKISSIFLIPSIMRNSDKEEFGMGVISIRHPASYLHLKDKVNIGTKIGYAYINHFRI